MFTVAWAWLSTLDPRIRAGLLALGFPLALVAAAVLPAWSLLLVAGVWVFLVLLGMASVVPVILRERRSEAGFAVLGPFSVLTLTPAAAAGVPWEWAALVVPAVMLVAVALLGLSILRKWLG
jgi:hypothetical protein